MRKIMRFLKFGFGPKNYGYRTFNFPKQSTIIWRRLRNTIRYR